MGVKARNTSRALVCVLATLHMVVQLPTKAASQERHGVLAFVREGEARGIWIVEPGGEERRLTNGQDYRPSWSPDGERIAFQRFDGDGSDLYLMDADGLRVRALTRRGGYYHPAWSPDGSQIVCGRVGNRRGEIVLMDADGSNQVRLTHNRWEETHPEWSPDGSRIAFASRRGGSAGSADVYLMNTDGSEERRLTRNQARDLEPTWSPNGRWIVFVSNRRGDQDLWLIHPDGTGLRILTHNDALDWAPQWSPDGTKIAFTRARYPKNQELMVVIDVRTRERFRLAISPAFELEPDWHPA
jgi:tol-pal system beta propeller repeat protein TolB